MDEDAAEKGGYESFMLKEIHEQPAALWDTIGDRLRGDGSVDLDGLGLDDAALARWSGSIAGLRHLVPRRPGGPVPDRGLGACRCTSRWPRVPLPHLPAGPGDLVLGISQSGETADTLAAMRVARERGAHVVAVTNIMGSQATRDADGVLYTRAPASRSASRPPRPIRPRSAALSLLALKLGRLAALTAAGALDLPTSCCAASPTRSRPTSPRRRRGRSWRPPPPTPSGPSSSTSPPRRRPSASRARSS